MKVIWAAYTNGDAIRRDCPQCGAAPGQWCANTRGRLRRVPCVLRTEFQGKRILQ